MIHALWKSQQPSMELYHVIQQKHNLKLKLVISGIPISYFFKLWQISRNGNRGGLTELIKNILALTLFRVCSDSFFLNSKSPEFQWSMIQLGTVTNLSKWDASVGEGHLEPWDTYLPRVHLAAICRRKQVQPISLLSLLLTPERSYIDSPLTQWHWNCVLEPPPPNTPAPPPPVAHFSCL